MSAGEGNKKGHPKVAPETQRQTAASLASGIERIARPVGPVKPQPDIKEP